MSPNDLSVFNVSTNLYRYPVTHAEHYTIMNYEFKMPLKTAAHWFSGLELTGKYILPFLLCPVMV